MITLSEVPVIYVNNTVYVMKNGNDSTGQVQRIDKPFLTIQAAINAADAYFTSRNYNNRVLIIVESGYYLDTIILKPYIDFDLQNSFIELTNNDGLTDNGVDFGSSPNYAFTNIIYGNATIKGQIAGSWMKGVNTKLLLNCDSIFGDTYDGMIIENAYIRVFANRIYSNDTLRNYTQAVNPYGAGKCEIFNADIFTPLGGIQSTIEFNQGTDFTNCGQLTLTNCRVSCRTDGDVELSCAINTGSTSSGGYGILKLYNTLIYSEFGGCICASYNSNMKVYYYGLNNANSNSFPVATGVLTEYISTLQVNSDVYFVPQY